MEGLELAGKIFTTWLTLVLGLILLPSAFGVSLGISEIYMKILVKTLEVSSCRDAVSQHLGGLEGDPGQWGPRVEPSERGLVLKVSGPQGVRFGLSSAVVQR